MCKVLYSCHWPRNFVIPRVVANIALWDSVGQDAQKYIDNKGLILSLNKPFKGDIAGDTDGDLVKRKIAAEDDSKAGYPPNCNSGYKVATVDGKKKCVASKSSSKGKSKTSSKSYDAEHALLEEILNLKESETDANTKSVKKKSNSSEVSSEDNAQEQIQSVIKSLELT